MFLSANPDNIIWSWLAAASLTLRGDAQCCFPAHLRPLTFSAGQRSITLFEIYFKDPFLAYADTASLPLFVVLYQAFRVLGYARLNKVFSPEAVRALRTIKYCAICLIGFVAVSVVFMPFSDPDDRPPGVVMRLLVTFGSIVVATAAAMFERIFQHAVEIKSENDLTV
jgi:hypothetical protein